MFDAGWLDEVFKYSVYCGSFVKEMVRYTFISII